MQCCYGEQSLRVNGTEQVVAEDTSFILFSFGTTSLARNTED